ncbi:MAG: hypothetical protein ABI442_01660 [Gemmatimonadaceae bacterium]
MTRLSAILMLAAATTFGGACGRYNQNAAAGDVISPTDAKQTVVLHVDNQNSQSMELRTILDGKSLFVGSVGGNDSTSLLLDATMFPAGNLFVMALPADGHGRAVSGPLAAGKGDRINFLVMPALDQSHAIVVR